MRAAIVLGVLAALAGVGLAASSGLLISRAALRPEVFLSLILLVTTVRALGVGRAALRYAERLTGHAAALKLGEDMRLKWFDTFSRFGRDLLALERSGALLAHVQTDVDARQMFLLRVNLPLVAFAGVWLGLGGWLSILDSLLALLAVVPLLLAALSVWQSHRPLANLTAQRLTQAREHSTRLLDALASSADGARHLAREELSERRQTIARLTLQEARLTTRLTFSRELMFALGVTGVLWRGAALVDAGALSGPLLAAVVLATAAAFDAVALLSAAPAAHRAWQEATRRAEALEAQEPQVGEASQTVTLPAGPLEIDLQDIHLERAGRRVLRGVNLRVPAGEKLVITGPSGGGKTTLLRLLTRDLDASAGEVRFSGIPVKSIKLADLRRAVSLHEQDAPLLDGTLAENLRLADPHANDERLTDLLTRFGLPHLPLDTWVGEGGMRLSGGERARVSIIRALLAPGRVVLLDEPTAHLDQNTEELVLNAIQNELRGRTLIVVSHRPGPLRLAGRVLRLEAGQLVPARPRLSGDPHPTPQRIAI